jgi:hypothetical protein
MPEQVSDANAAEMAEALLDELDRDAQKDALPPAERPATDGMPAAGQRH